MGLYHNYYDISFKVLLISKNKNGLIKANFKSG